MVKYLAEKYPRLINSVDSSNDNGLHVAAREGNIDTVVYLIEELEMDPTVKDQGGQNVFLYACYSGNIEMVNYLAQNNRKLITKMLERTLERSTR